VGSGAESWRILYWSKIIYTGKIRYLWKSSRFPRQCIVPGRVYKRVTLPIRGPSQKHLFRILDSTFSGMLWELRFNIHRFVASNNNDKNPFVRCMMVVKNIYEITLLVL